MSYCTEEISRKLRIISFIATIGVVIIHTNHLERLVGTPFAWWVGNIIGYLNRWAVPYFFVISGFFFERAFQGQKILPYWGSFLQKKKYALFVPYLLWGIVYGLPVMSALQVGVALQHGAEDVWAKTVTGYVGALGHLLFGRSIFAKFILQGISWILTLLICISVAWVVKRYFPKSYRVLCGGR